MAIPVVCESCDARFKVADERAGARIKCPKCGSVIAVPDEDEDDDRPRRRRSRAEEDEDDDRPRRKTRAGKKRGRKGLFIGLLVGGGVVLAGGVVLLILLLGGSRDNPNVTEENFDKIGRQMSIADVEKILGKGDKVSFSEVAKALHERESPPPVAGGKEEATTYKWKNKGETILLLVHPEGYVMAGWFVREQKSGKPKYKLLGFGKLE
jgi:predicted Zn finger-like uncharacterized protein